MKTFSTYILAVNPNTGEQCKFVGQNVNAENADKAREYCDNNGLGYLFIDVEIYTQYDSDIEGLIDACRRQVGLPKLSAVTRDIVESGVWKNSETFLISENGDLIPYVSNRITIDKIKYAIPVVMKRCTSLLKEENPIIFNAFYDTNTDGYFRVWSEYELFSGIGKTIERAHRDMVKNMLSFKKYQKHLKSKYPEFLNENFTVIYSYRSQCQNQ